TLAESNPIASPSWPALPLERVLLAQRLLDQASGPRAGEELPLETEPGEHLAAGEVEVLHRGARRQSGDSEQRLALDSIERVGEQAAATNPAGIELGRGDHHRRRPGEGEQVLEAGADLLGQILQVGLA